MGQKLDKFIVKHDRTLAWVMAGLMLTWYVGGIFAIEYVHPVVFISIWIPVGLLFAFFAYKW